MDTHEQREALTCSSPHASLVTFHDRAEAGLRMRSTSYLIPP